MTASPKQKPILSLFDLTGNWSRPYRERGYEVVQIDLQSGTDIMTWDYRVLPRTYFKQTLVKDLFGKLYGDKGYLSKSLFETLFHKGVHVVTKLRKNMKNCLMSLKDKIMLRKRAVIETVNDELKNICQIEHSRHRSMANFISNLASGLLAYCFFPKKPSIQFQTQNNNQLSLIP